MNPLQEKTISDLLGYKFYVPDYQRGYRWTLPQIDDLLNDVWEFVNTKDPKYEHYCLQPIVVKKRADSSYEIIDGQQRLTTIFLILQHLKPFIESDRKTFEIEYETRVGSKDFLINIADKYEHAYSDLEQRANKNIDFFHMFQAFKRIKGWYDKQAEQGERAISSAFINPFLDKVKVIWYEPPTHAKTGGSEIFTRLNMGKIPLTNAELIKAFFLNQKNFLDSVTRWQLEIASEWDGIEYALREPALWNFINKAETSMPNHIEFIFSLQLGIIFDPDNPHQGFRKFSNDHKDHNKIEVWQETIKYYYILSDWFHDHALYHKVGYLITVGTDLAKLITQSKKSRKTKFLQQLDTEIKEYFKQIHSIGEISRSGKHHGKIKPILLLYNIETILNKKNDYIRFPFDRYKQDKWDIEHIHALATKLKDSESQIEWLEEAQEFITDGILKEKINEYISRIENNKDTEKMFIEASQEIDKYFTNNRGESDNTREDDDDLSNLALLDRGTNRGYKNGLFPIKRKWIINKDRNGQFIPICTKQVFLKYYSGNIEHIWFWSQYDRKEYLEDIEQTLSPYIEIVKNGIES